MALNLVVVVATLLVSYVLGHAIAVLQARRRNLAKPAFFDYGAHRALWSDGRNYRRDPWFWIMLVIAVVIVEALTKRSSFGIGFAVAVGFGFVAGGLYRWLRARADHPRD
jgi:hypothetical protein